MKKNKIDVLLVNPACRLPFLVPLGLGYVASVLRKDGYNVKVLDINGLGYSAERIEDVIKHTEFDIVGIGGLSSVYKNVKWLANIIKRNRPHVPIIAGNMVATAHPELLLKSSNVDVAVIDEGEIAFKELVTALEQGKDFKEIKGIYYKNINGEIIKTAPRERICDLDVLPWPAWDLFPMEVYLNNSTISAESCGFRAVNISTVRGCPYECTFCSHPFGRRVYMRSPRSVMDEIKELKKRYMVEFIYIMDDLFLVDEKNVLEFCDRMVSSKLNIRWLASGRVNVVNDKLLRKMRRAGCVELGYGFESGSQAILDRMKKRITVKQAQDAIRMTKMAGIKIAGSFIFGMPGETRETVKETLDFIKRTQLRIYRFFYATPYPNTELYEIAKKMGRLPSDEDRYVESLGEMWTTFRVNLTDIPDDEFIKLKNLTEVTAKKSLGFKLQLEEFVENWHRRFFITRLSLRHSGIIPTIKMIFSRIGNRLKTVKVFNLLGL